MVTINIEYKGNLRCEAVHEPSGIRLLTDAPKDNHGRGESFSPTDLLATALGNCMLTIMGITAGILNVNLEGTTVQIVKEMSPPPRRIAKLSVKLTMPKGIDESHRAKLEHAAFTCPVHKSLHPDIEIPVIFEWD